MVDSAARQAPAPAAAAVITFPDGLVGLEQYREFVLTDVPGEERFKLLRSTADPAFALVVTEPFWFKPDYTLDVPETYAARLGEKNPLVLVTVTLAPRPEDITANLLGPLVISRRGLGFQIIAGEAYSTRYRLLGGEA